MYRFLLTRRWMLITFSAVVIILACVRLGFWQLDRYEARAAGNADTEAALLQPAIPIEQLLTIGGPESDETEWRSVTARGQWDAENQVVLRYRRLDGQNGVHVLTPLVTPQGPAVLVDRGFVVTEERSSRATPPEAPPPPSGEVEVTVRLRASEERGLGSAAETRSIRYVNVPALADQLPYPMYGQWGELVEQDPPADDVQLQPIPEPKLTSGPSLAYAIQWWLFALIGMIGYVVLARGEARGGVRERPGPKKQSAPSPGLPDRAPR